MAVEERPTRTASASGSHLIVSRLGYFKIPAIMITTSDEHVPNYSLVKISGAV